MAAKLKVDQLETVDGTGNITVNNQLTGLTSASMPTGSVLQVVQGGNGAQVTTTSTSYQATTLEATITPSSASSKILVTYSSNSYQADGGQGSSTIYRMETSGASATELTGHSDGCTKNWKDGSRGVSPHVGSWLDSPNTTDARLYKIYCRSINGTSMSFPTNEDITFSHITLMEIAG